MLGAGGKQHINAIVSFIYLGGWPHDLGSEDRLAETGTNENAPRRQTAVTRSVSEPLTGRALTFIGGNLVAFANSGI